MNETSDKQETLVERAVRRLHDNIARREATEDVEALKAVLLEMASQKERADDLERELAEANEYRRLNSDRASEFQRINGEKNAEIDNLREQLATAKADIRARNERDLASSATRESVAKFKVWIDHSDDSGSLMGESKVALDAQKRVLRQLLEYLDGDEYLALHVEDSFHRYVREKK